MGSIVRWARPAATGCRRASATPASPAIIRSPSPTPMTARSRSSFPCSPIRPEFRRHSATRSPNTLFGCRCRPLPPNFCDIGTGSNRPASEQGGAMAIDTTSGHPGSAQPSLRRTIVAAMVGNVLEWFDFVVFGFFAVTIAEVFFPIDDPTAQMLVTWGTFGLAYFVRPLGAIVVGSYTDRAGRKAGLLLSI